MTKCDQWYAENVLENEDDIREMGELGRKIILDTFDTDLGRPEVVVAYYGTVLETIIQKIKEQRKTYSEFKLNVANRFEIGYTLDNDDDTEAPGNFMIFMRHLENSKVNTIDADDTDDALSICVQWNAINVTTQAGLINEIVIAANQRLSDLIDIRTPSSEYVMPLFCTIHDQLVNILRIRRSEKDTSEYEISLFGWFDAGCQLTENGDYIYFSATPSSKLELKDNEIAQSHQD